MSVTRIQRAAATASGKHGKGFEHSYSCPYLVTVSGAHDGPHAIASHMESNGFMIGTPYLYGTDSDPLSFLSSISPTRIANSTDQWLVTLSYEPLEKGEDKPDEDGDPTGDPLSWGLELSFTTSLYQQPVWQAWNVDAFPVTGAAGGYNRMADTLGAVVNSAGVVLDPPLMRNQTEVSMHIAGCLEDGAMSNVSKFTNAINHAAVAFNPALGTKYNLTIVSFPQYSLKCTGATHTFKRQNGTKYWELSYEIKYRPAASATNAQDRWLETVLDRGITRRAAVGDPDGLGGTLSNGDLREGVAAATPIRDFDGNRVPEMVLLDGGGQPAPPNSTGFFFRWRVDRVEDFGSLPFGVFI